ncbi:outer membrane beta-barrel protein [Winogradskyella sp. 3972H.M.0a.05]|uniref:porin family protein n=1 Tax=Winogradskyella sp. 3972H.M.0a.05 TaxID=2950277 RepID=UPI003392DBBA
MRAIITLFILFFAISFCTAQDVKYGVKAGMSISNMDYEGTPIVRNEHRNGFVFGVFIEYGLTEKLSLVPELQFSGEGANLEGFRNDYINLPVLLKYTFFEKLGLGIGPQAGLKVNKKNDGFKNMVFSGVGYIEYAITDEFALDARYNYGFSNVFDDEPGFPEAKTGVIQFGINYKI